MRYDEVRIGSEDEKYSLNIGDGVQGSYIIGTGDKLKSRHDGMKFSTYDQDNDNNGTLFFFYEKIFEHILCNNFRYLTSF